MHCEAGKQQSALAARIFSNNAGLEMQMRERVARALGTKGGCVHGRGRAHWVDCHALRTVKGLNGSYLLALVPTEVLLIEQRPQTKKRMSVMTCDGLRSAAGAATTEAGEKAVAERQGPPADLPRGEYLPTGQNVMTHGHCGVASSCRWARRAAAWLRLKRSTMAGMPPVAAQATAGFSAWASWELAGNAHSQCGTGAATQV